MYKRQEDILSLRIYNGFIKPLKENKSKSVSDLLVYVFTERIENFTEKEKACLLYTSDAADE